MCARVDAFFSNALNWIKAAFGRSRTIAINVFGVLSMVWMELSDTLGNFNFDDFFKHEVAAAIGLGLSILNIVMRVITVNPVSFSVTPPAPVAPVAPVQEAQSPKAE